MNFWKVTSLWTNKIRALKQRYGSCNFLKDKFNSANWAKFPEKDIFVVILHLAILTNVLQLDWQAFLSCSLRILNLKVICQICQVNSTAGGWRSAIELGRHIEISTEVHRESQEALCNSEERGNFHNWSYKLAQCTPTQNHGGLSQDMATYSPVERM